MNQPSPFWSRSYGVIRQKLRLNLYFGETKVSEFSQLVEEATAEIGKLGLKPSADTMFLTSNRAGMHLSCWLPCDPAELDTLTAKLEGEKWKMASD
jgi:hypothetical protein